MSPTPLENLTSNPVRKVEHPTDPAFAGTVTAGAAGAVTFNAGEALVQDPAALEYFRRAGFRVDGAVEIGTRLADGSTDPRSRTAPTLLGGQLHDALPGEP